MLRDELSTPGPGTLVGCSRTASVRDAALINGAAGHALDFDDTHTLMSGHPTAPVLPAALAVAEQTGATGEAPGDGAHRRDRGRVSPRRVDGAWPLPRRMARDRHVRHDRRGRRGRSPARARCRSTDRMPWPSPPRRRPGSRRASARWPSRSTPARRRPTACSRRDSPHGGFTGNPAVLEAPTRVWRPRPVAPARMRTGWPDSTTAGPIRDTLFKYHAACYLTHASINAALSVGDDLAADEVARVEVHVAPDLLRDLQHRRARDRPGRQVQPPGDRRDGAARRRHRGHGRLQRRTHARLRSRLDA